MARPRLQQEWRPVSWLWQRTQARYAVRYGSRFLLNVKSRCKATTKATLGNNVKETWPSIQIKRRRVVSPSVRSGLQSVNVFGYEQCAAEDLQRPCEEEEEERGAVFD